MRLISPNLHFLALVANDAAAMSSRQPYRGRNPWRRGFSDRSGDERDAFVGELSGDLHFGTVRDANYGFQRGQRGNNWNYGGYPRQSFHPRGTPFGAPSQQQRPPFRAPSQRPDDFRSWEYAGSQPPSQCERFVVLSYNILADYLAKDHRQRLYFHIPPYILDWEWRKRRIMIELGLWAPDIMCFQEVDRFCDLEEELKLQGYCGIWKMRTGTPLDGCAIFWRTSRFGLLHQEDIEFTKFGFRDNIAQICVLESKSQSSDGCGSATFSSSHCSISSGAHRVVICNIHVLYNPNRGDIKLGQLRVLLDQAHSVSRTWGDAPVIICGDFNCTPKSPLYNFISEQKLSLSGLAKNEVSGQSSACIYPSWSSRPYSGSQSPTYNVIKPSTPVDDKMGNNNQNACSMEMTNQYDAENNTEKTSVKDLQDPLLKSDGSSDVVSEICFIDGSEITLSQNVQEGELLEASLCLNPSVDHINYSCNNKGEFMKKLNLDGEHRSTYSSEGTQVSSTEHASTCEVNCKSTNSKEANRALLLEVEKFSSESDFLCVEQSASTSNNLSSMAASSTDLEGDSLLPMNLGTTDVERKPYDPYLWTPEEVAAASGNAECTLVKHPLKLKSAYAEVEDYSGTKDSSREPQITSYNRRFMGTVDYIWCSEGLQTIKVLDTIPKHVLQRTPGFPTRKWGSDHLALVCQLAFTKELPNEGA